MLAALCVIITTPLTLCHRTLVFHSTSRTETDLLNIFSQYKQMNYFISANLLKGSSGRGWVSVCRLL